MARQATGGIAPPGAKAPRGSMLQRELIMAIIDKVLKQPITQIPAVIEKASTCVTTDFSIADIISLAQQFKDEGDLVVYNAMVPSYTQMIGDVSYVINDAAMTAEMMEVVEAGGDPSEFVSNMTGSYVPSSSGTSGSKWNNSYTGSYADHARPDASLGRRHRRGRSRRAYCAHLLTEHERENPSHEGFSSCVCQAIASKGCRRASLVPSREGARALHARILTRARPRGVSPSARPGSPSPPLS